MSKQRHKTYLLAFAFLYLANAASASSFAESIFFKLEASVNRLGKAKGFEQNLFLMPPPSGSVSVQVNAGSDDAEQNLLTNAVVTNSNDLELVYDLVGQSVGLRFKSITIPKNAAITSSYIEFYNKTSLSTAVTLTINGEASDNPGTFTTASNNITGRPKTAASVSWTPGNWTTVNAAYQSADISNIVQEIVNRSGWASGNSMVMLMNSSSLNYRRAYSYEAGAALAPRLVVNYTLVEVCGNGIDDDGDGLIDGADLDCGTFCPTGSLSLERWLNIGGGTVITDLTGNANYPNNPSETASLTSFDGPDNYADNYGTRVRGYISPSQTGVYSFNLTSDDASELYLSTDANPANKVLISSVTGYTGTAEYTKYTSQTSSNLTLVAGQNYYVEMLHKEGGGGDHFQVYWKTPSNASWTIVPGANLRPFGCSEICGNGIDDDGDGLVDGADADCGSFCNTGKINLERWLSITGTAITDLTSNVNFPNTASQTTTLTSFDGPDNFGDNFGQRARGYISPTQTGIYTFNLTSDDTGELYLSSDANPANKKLIASVSGWTNQTEYTKYASQTSYSIMLHANRNYYVEMLNKEGSGGDHFQVYWTTPSNSSWTIIPGTNLRPYACSETCGNNIDDDGDGFTDCNCDLMTNGEFDNGLTAWGMTIQAGSSATGALDNTSQLSGVNSGAVTITTASGTDWHIQAYQAGLSLQSGKTYTVSFQSKSTGSRTMGVVLQQAVSPYTVYWAQTVTLSATGSTFTFDYPSTITNNGQVALIFNMGASNKKVWIDKISVTPKCASEICGNGIDDDGNGLIDCADGACPAPTTTISGTTTVCNGISTTLTATGGGTYAWSNGATSAAVTVTPSVSTTYTVTVTNASACTVTASQLVTVNSLPAAAISGTNTICTGASTTLTASGGGTYLWSTGASTAAINVTPASTTTYTVTVTAASGCTATASRTVTVSSCSENCSNGLDDDSDGLVDAADPDCGNCTPTGVAGSTINPITGSNGFQILSEGNFTLNQGPHIHGPLGIGGNLIVNTTAQAEVNMDPIGSYVFPGDGSTSTGLLVGGGITWTNGVVSVKNGKYIHIANSTGCIQSDNGVNMSTQVLPTGTSYNNAKRIEGTIDQTPNPAVFQSGGLNIPCLFSAFRVYSENMATCTANVQLMNTSGTAIASNTVSSPQDVKITTLANGKNVLNLTTTSLNNITNLTFETGGFPSATKVLIINVNLNSNFVWNNSNMAGIGNSSAPYILWNFSGTSTYNLTVNTSSLVVGTIYAPNHNLLKNGSGDIDGNLIAKSISINNAGEIHYFPFASNILMCGTTPEVCGNGLDDDGDGLVDCGDSDCPSCTTSSCVDGVKLIAQKEAKATGSGAAGKPIMSNFFIPAGNNRVVFVAVGFEREHCQPGDNCSNSNTSGVGLADNFADPEFVAQNGTNVQITARFVGSGGTIDKMNALTLPTGDLRFGNQQAYPTPPTPNIAATYYSRELYFMAIYESEINTLLSGAASGNITISLPDAKNPLDDADEAMILGYAFANVEQTTSGIVRSGSNTSVISAGFADAGMAGNYSMSISDIDNGQEPDEPTDGFLVLGFNGVEGSGFNTIAGFTPVTNATINNNAGDFTPFNEPDGFSVSGQFRSGPSSGNINAVTIQSAAPTGTTVNGGMLFAFTLESCSTVETCGNGLDDDGDGLTDCVDPDCKRITLATPVVSACINQPLQDVATVSVQVSWVNAPANDQIEVSIYGQTERINTAALTSPQTVIFTLPANGATNKTITAAWRNTTSLCSATASFNLPTACSSDQVGCSILYLCGLDKPYDGDSWDHGFMAYLDEINGSNIVMPVLTKADASGMGTYNVNSPNTPISLTLSNYSLVVISATTEGSIAPALVAALKSFSGAVMNSNYDIIDDLGMSSVGGSYQYQNNLFVDNSLSKEIYNFNNDINPSSSKVFTRGNYTAAADAYLWTNSGEQALGVNGVYFGYSSADAMPGVAAGHGRRVFLGYHMNGVYANSQNGGALPAPVSSYFVPATHLTLEGKNYFDLAILDATKSCNAEICNNGIDDNDNGLVDCAETACGLPVVSGVSKTNASNCPSLNNGQITVTAGGVNMEYSVNGGSSYQSSNVFTGLAVGSYNIRVRNSVTGCFANYASNPVQITGTTCPEICGNGLDDDGDGLADCLDTDCKPSVNAGTDVNICFGTSYTISASASGGTAPYTYAWSNSLGAGQSKTVTPLTTTTYIVTVTSTGGCTATDAVLVTVTTCTEVCTDGLDNDGDGLIDCADPDCAATGAPQLANDDYQTCPGVVFQEQPIFNDNNIQNAAYSIYSNPSKGNVTINYQGIFTYTPTQNNCGVDSFQYQVCNAVTGCCDHATVVLHLGDNVPPVLQNVPADLTIACGEPIPTPPVVFGVDACPGIYVTFDEVNNQVNAGSCQNYTIVRTWSATDNCGNTGSASQTITVMDSEMPEIFRVYTLENGNQALAGINSKTGTTWKHVKFPVSFANTPLVFSQVITNNAPEAVITRVRNVDSEGFDLKIQEEENGDGIHTAEKVAWFAIEPGNLTDGSVQASKIGGVTQTPKLLNYQTPFITSPEIIFASQTYAEADPVQIRFSNDTGTSIQFYLEEEQSKDVEVTHAAETVAYIAAKSGIITDENGDFAAEAGSATLSETWNTFYFGKKYSKPVVVFGGQLKGNDPATVRVRNVTSTSFEARIQEWQYLNGNLPTRTVCYFVMEGSIPAFVQNPCSEVQTPMLPGVNLFSVDNCDNQVSMDYSESSTLTPNGQIKTLTWISADDCGNTATIIRNDTCRLAAVKLKVNLLGPKIGNSANTTLMRDDLLHKGLVPIENPYELEPDGNPGQSNHTALASLMEVTGNNAIVDWVLVELRDAEDSKLVLKEVPCLLQRDGDVVTELGSNIIAFDMMPEGKYHVYIKHRNHLGMITATPPFLTLNNPPLLDFSQLYGPVFNASISGKHVNGSLLMWAGDFNGDDRIIYQGPGNDVFFLFSEVLSAPENTQNLANFIQQGYKNSDINMDGNCIYQGPSNDRSMLLLQTILAHPSNTFLLANFIALLPLP